MLLTENRNSSYFLIILSFIFFCLVVYRAQILSMTHDEAGTYMFFYDVNFLSFFTDSSTWRSANNHLLNTLAYKLTIAIAGHSDFNIRIGNVLSFALYLVSIFFIGKDVFKYNGSRILLFTLLVANPYVIDFFSLSRGYGMSIAFLMFAYWQFWKFFDSEKLINFMFGFLALGFSTFAIMSNLIFIPSIALSIWIVIFLNYRRYKLEVPRYIFYIPIITFLVIIGILYIPLTALSSLDEFRFGTRSISRPFTSLIANSLRHRLYLGSASYFVFAALFFITLFASLYSGIKRFVREENKYNNFNVFLVISFISLMLALLAAYLILGSKFPVDRKSIMFVPLLGLLFTMCLDRSYKIKKTNLIGLVTSFLLMAHFVNALDIEKTREWWYDAYTEKMMDVIVSDAGSKKVVVGSHWFYNPVLNYYRHTKNLEYIEISRYNKKIEADKTYDYFVIMEGDEYKTIKDKYDNLYKTKSGILVLKKKKSE